jgi:hypothetical protein
MSDTIYKRPQPKRPENGLLAWLENIGYISAEYNADAMLQMVAYPMPESGETGWASRASWGDVAEATRDSASLGEALRELWRKVDNAHTIFKSLDDAAKQPAFYNDDKWIDADTQASFDLLTNASATAFGGDWMIVVMYHPVENPETRVQTRLLAQNKTVDIEGHGPTVHEALDRLYRHAAPEFLTD